MTNPAEEIYVIFNKKTGGRKKYLSEKMGWGGIGQFAPWREGRLWGR